MSNDITKKELKELNDLMVKYVKYWKINGYSKKEALKYFISIVRGMVKEVYGRK